MTTVRPSLSVMLSLMGCVTGLSRSMRRLMKASCRTGSDSKPLKVDAESRKCQI